MCALTLSSQLPRILTHFMIAVFVMAGSLSAHHGHLDFGGAHPSGHVRHLAVDHGVELAQEKVADQGDLEKTDCDLSHSSSCGMGHCCFPLPITDLVQAKGDHPLWENLISSWERREELQEPPPPSYGTVSKKPTSTGSSGLVMSRMRRPLP